MVAVLQFHGLRNILLGIRHERSTRSASLNTSNMLIFSGIIVFPVLIICYKFIRFPLCYLYVHHIGYRSCLCKGDEVV